MVRLRVLVMVLLASAGGCETPAPRPGGVPRRIVSLAPSITEIVYALGAGERLVGVCSQCNFPAEAAGLPRVGGYLVPSVEMVLAARPDLVVVVPSPGNREPVRAIERAGIPILVVGERSLAELWASMREIARALELGDAGERLVTRVSHQLDVVRARVAALPVRRVLVVVDHDPLVAVGGGTLQDELLTLAGGANVARDAGSVWPTITLEVVVERAPEVIVDAGMSGTGGAERLFAGLTTVPAVRDGRIVRLADDTLFRAGPRVPEAAAALGAAIHPEAFAAAARAG